MRQLALVLETTVERIDRAAMDRLTESVGAINSEPFGGEPRESLVFTAGRWGHDGTDNYLLRIECRRPTDTDLRGLFIDDFTGKPIPVEGSALRRVDFNQLLPGAVWTVLHRAKEPVFDIFFGVASADEHAPIIIDEGSQ